MSKQPRHLEICCAADYPSGKVWAAVKAGRVLDAITMHTDAKIDFEDYKARALQDLGAIGDVVYGEIIYRDGACYFIRETSRAAANAKRVGVELGVDASSYVTDIPSGWSILGIVFQGDDKGALVQHADSKAYAMLVGKKLVEIDPKKLRAALYRATGIKTPEQD